MTTGHIGAAVDVGSNSVHLLVARIDEAGSLQVLRDESVLLGLGDVVDRYGVLLDEAIGSLVAALAGYRRAAEALGARDVTLVATEPLRRAGNRVEVAARVATSVGLPLHVLTERQEGQLTYLGVTVGRPPTRSLLVVDIGGGSSEVVLAVTGEALQVFSLPSGSARLSRGIVEHDPPTPEELDGLLGAAHWLVATLPAATPAQATFVGGTATNLARLAPLRRDGLALAYRWLASRPAEQISRQFGVNLRRAGQLPAGVAIVDALLSHFSLDEATVSDASLRDGAIVAAARLGESWPDLLGSHLDASLGTAPVGAAEPQETA